MSSFLVQKIHPRAQIPTKGSSLSAGYDLSSCESVDIPPQRLALVSTGLAFSLPQGTYGRIAPRSGLAVKHMIDVFAGVCDADYRGEYKIALYNASPDKIFHVHEGDRVAQLVLERIANHEHPLQCVESLVDTERGVRGFGSTGMETRESPTRRVSMT